MPPIDEILDDFSILGFREHDYTRDGKSAIGLWAFEQASLVWLGLNAPVGDFLECGSFCGGSSCLLGITRRYRKLGRTLYAVDIDFSAWGGAYDRNVFQRARLQDIITQIECNCKDLGEKLKYHNPKLSLVFLDSYHSYKAVITEFEAVKPYLVPGALIAFHDCDSRLDTQQDMEDYYKLALEHHDDWMRGDIPDVNSADLAAYHAAEADQDFFISEAVSWICKTYNYNIVDIPIPPYQSMEYRTGPFRHGTTNPKHSLVAIS